jgi:hypothetical protein
MFRGTSSSRAILVILTYVQGTGVGHACRSFKLVDSRDVLLSCDSNDLTILIPVDRWSARKVCQCVLVLLIGFQYSSRIEQSPWSHLEASYVVSLSLSCLFPCLMTSPTQIVLGTSLIEQSELRMCFVIISITPLIAQTADRTFTQEVSRLNTLCASPQILTLHHLLHPLRRPRAALHSPCWPTLKLHKKGQHTAKTNPSRRGLRCFSTMYATSLKVSIF